jgi:hypothetical protein
MTSAKEINMKERFLLLKYENIVFGGRQMK